MASFSKRSLFGCTFLASLLIYLLTLPPDLTNSHYGFDGGELITTAVTGGVPHPSGYPTYLLLGNLFGRLLPGPVAFRFNLFSAFSVALASGLLALAISRYRPTAHPAAAPATALSFAFAFLVWSQAIISEVYGLNLLCLALLLLWLLQEPQTKRAHLGGGLLFGLSLTTHLTSLLFGPLLLWRTQRRYWPQCLLGLLLGLTPFLILPLLAQGDPPVAWGRADTLDGWWAIISGQIYRPNVGAAPFEVVIERLSYWVGAWPWFWLGLPLVLVGLALDVTEQSRRPLALALAGTGLLYALYALTYTAVDAVLFFLPGLLLLSILLASTLNHLRWAALLLPIVLLALNFNQVNETELVRPAAERLFTTVPAQAVVVTPGDPTIGDLWYFQHVEGQRPDIILVDELLFQFDWYREKLAHRYPALTALAVDDLARFVEENGRERPFCFVSLLEMEDNHCFAPRASAE